MSTMAEMAQEYKVAAAKLAISIKAHQAAGDLTPAEMASLRLSLRDLREAAHLMSCYYDTPRQASSFTLIGLRARRSRDDH